MMAWAAIRLFAFLLSVVIGLCRVHTHWLVGGGGWMGRLVGLILLHMPQQQSWAVFESLASGWRGNGV